MASTNGESFLFPSIEPFDQGYMDVGGGHSIYYEQCGNPAGVPVHFLHGGPGLGCGPGSRRWFDPKKFRIIIHDQRGCGRSKFVRRLNDNKTTFLISDVFKLTDRLVPESKPILFGGSWGSTLALLCAEEYPERISGLILRGVFLGSKREMSEMGTAGFFYPREWRKFLATVPVNFRNDPTLYYFLQMQKIGPTALEHAFMYSHFISLTNALELTEEEVDTELSEENPENVLAQALVETYYLNQDNHCFIGESQILDNAWKIRHLPISIVQGRYDLACPPKNALMLAEALELPGDRLHFVLAGHHSYDTEITKKLIPLTNEWMYDLVSKKE